MKQLIFLLLLLANQAYCQQLHITTLTPTTDASFRGLSAVDDSVVWVSGSKGWVGRSTNGGRDWQFAKVKGYEQCDFRSLYAFDRRIAIIANAGAPAYILRSTDGGSNWTLVYTNTDSAAFFDGIDFRNDKDGMVYGDPIKGKMLLLHTNDGGKAWKELPPVSRPSMATGEASFAASGTNIRYSKNNKIVIATGGTVSRLLLSEDNGNSWRAVATPILQGQSSTGIFSFAFHNENTGIIVGGDYKRDSLATDHVFYTTDKGKTWKAPLRPTRGYRECVQYLDAKTLIATGPSGTDISYDAGINWQPLSDEKGYHVVRKSRKGKLVIIAGGAGKIGLVR